MHVTFVLAIFLLNSQNHKVDLIKIGVVPDNWVQIDHIPQGLYSIHPRTGQCYYYALCDEVKRACPMRKGWTQCPAQKLSLVSPTNCFPQVAQWVEDLQDQQVILWHWTARVGDNYVRNRMSFPLNCCKYSEAKSQTEKKGWQIQLLNGGTRYQKTTIFLSGTGWLSNK